MNAIISCLHTAYKILQGTLDPAVEGNPYRHQYKYPRGRARDDRPNPPIFRRRFALR